MTQSDDLDAVMQQITDRALGHAGPFGPTARQQPIEQFLETADRHKRAGVELQGGARLSFAKQAVLRLARLYTVEQATYNQAILSSVLELHAGLNEVRADIDRRLGNSQATLSGLELAVENARRAMEQAQQQSAALAAKIETSLFELAEQRTADRAELATIRARLDLFLHEVRGRLADKPADGEWEAFASDLEHQLDPLYEQLEERFRGSRAEILERQREHLPLFIDLAGGDAPVVDIGCGRGEWLEIMREAGIPAYGVDTNEQFVEANRQRGLDVRMGDAIEHLSSLPPASIGGVTGFHIAEHLPFPTLVALIDAAFVATRPGGVLLLETPNPTNVVVGSSAFYLDPTHRNPLHPELMAFLVGARGFADASIEYLHEPDQSFRVPEAGYGSDADRQSAAHIVQYLNWAFFGPLDYAVVGRKPATTA